ncbi:MAG: fumarate reductase/succinate dehydrogenase flavoprotein subunit [Euryarchaeota archaeon]|nr:fumarate reductase/succinate dehydrogenase flavoprotein subunit [Euryarchaeota archaeon]
MPAVSKTHEFDVIVVGAGGAGLRAAIEASREGARTAIICKSLLGKAHTVMAEGGAAAALRNTDPRDTWKVHFRDTIRGSKYLSQWPMAMLHAQEAPERIRELERWGAVFDRTKDGWINQRNFGGHQYPRLAHVGDRTGLELIRTLQDKGVHSGIEVFMEVTVTKLFTKDGTVTGCLAYERETGKFHLFKAKSVVVATGGFGKAWKYNSNSWEYTGDGHTLAYEAGAELMDMEFFQFHPTGMVWPPSVRGTLVTEGVRGEGGILRNSEGKRFMYDYIPEMFQGDFAETEEEVQRWLDGDKDARRPPELLTRDVVARAIRSEVKAGRGTEHGGVYLDISWRDAEYVKKKLPSMYHQFKELANVDITKVPMEVGPTAHYAMGGIRVDHESQESTTVRGLYACGECAAGLHGANRLGGNSLTDLLVFGKRAGEHAARRALETKEHPEIPAEEVQAAIDAAVAPLERESGENPFKVHEELEELMQDNAGMIREAEDLKKALEGLAAFAERVRNIKVGGNIQYNPGWHEALDIHNLLVCAEATARAALEREESRGGHTRADFPQSDAEYWQHHNIVLKKGADGRMEVRRVPLTPWSDEVNRIMEASAEELSGDTHAEVHPL